MQRIGFAGSALAVTATVVILLVQSGNSRPSWAAEVRAVAAAAGRAPAVHLTMQARVSDREDLNYVDLNAPLQNVEAWVEWPSGGSPGRVRVEFPGTVYVHDGMHSQLYRETFHLVSRRESTQPNLDLVWPAAWLEHVTDVPENARVIEDSRDATQSRLVLRWDAPVVEGRPPRFFDEFEREVAIEWDSVTEALTRYERWVLVDGQRHLYSRLSSLDYPSYVDPAWFRLDLASDVQVVDQPYHAVGLEHLGPEETARAFFDAAIAGDWSKVESLCPSPALVAWLRDADPSRVLSVGASFRTGTYAGVYVPYRVELGGNRRGEVHEHNLALRNDNPVHRWVVDGGL